MGSTFAARRAGIALASRATPASSAATAMKVTVSVGFTSNKNFARTRVTASAAGLGKAELLAKGIYEALMCTFAGLLVAIPILLVYYFFIARIERYVIEMNELSIDFADHFLERSPRKSLAENYENALKSEI